MGFPSWLNVTLMALLLVFEDWEGVAVFSERRGFTTGCFFLGHRSLLCWFWGWGGSFYHRYWEGCQIQLVESNYLFIYSPLIQQRSWQNSLKMAESLLLAVSSSHSQNWWNCISDNLARIAYRDLMYILF